MRGHSILVTLCVMRRFWPILHLCALRNRQPDDQLNSSPHLHLCCGLCSTLPFVVAKVHSTAGHHVHQGNLFGDLTEQKNQNWQISSLPLGQGTHRLEKQGPEDSRSSSGCTVHPWKKSTNHCHCHLNSPTLAPACASSRRCPRMIAESSTSLSIDQCFPPDDWQSKYQDIFALCSEAHLSQCPFDHAPTRILSTGKVEQGDLGTQVLGGQSSWFWGRNVKSKELRRKVT